MNKSQIIRFSSVLLVVSIMVLVSFIVGYKVGNNNAQIAAREAGINAGIARWQVDEKTGDLRFEYLKPDSPEVHRQKAVEAGAAFYSIDPQTAEVSFNFICSMPPKDVPPTALVVEPKDELLPLPEKVKPKKEGLSINLK